MSFNPNIPQPGDLLSDSQGDLLQNMISLDTSFGIDHYTFSDSSINNGKHREVSSPISVPPGHPATTTDPKIYGMQDNPTMPVIQYSRAPNNAVPSPVTYLQSPAAGINFSVINTTTNVFDFTGISRAIGVLYACNFQTTPYNAQYTVFWTATGPLMVLNLVFPITSVGIVAQQAGNILQLRSTTNDLLFTQLRWTFQLLRIEV